MRGASDLSLLINKAQDDSVTLHDYTTHTECSDPNTLDKSSYNNYSYLHIKIIQILKIIRKTDFTLSPRESKCIFGGFSSLNVIYKAVCFKIVIIIYAFKGCS